MGVKHTTTITGKHISSYLQLMVSITKDVWDTVSTNEYTTVTLEKPRRPRSTGKHSQNHHFRGHCGDIARQAGCSPEFAAFSVKVWAVEHLAYPSSVVMGKLYPQSEADASIEDANKLIEAAHYLAAEYGYELRESE